MAVKFARWFVIGLAVMFLLAMPSAMYSCGPWFDEATFAFTDAPQPAQAEFAAGKLGIVLPTLRRSYLIVAYRYLNGLKLNAGQQQDAIDVWNRKMGSGPNDRPITAIDDWLKARSEVKGAPRIAPYDPYASLSPSYQFFLNCPEEAFRAASATLAERSRKYGEQSAALRAWVTAQDQVFSNCDRKARAVPAALDSADPLLRADRNYQIAAAQFYAGDFDGALAAFDAIAKDPASPWARYGSYLAARALVRKATLNTPEEDKVDAPTMQEAQRRLEQVAGDPHTAMHDAAARLLEFVRFRTEPEKRVEELEQLMVKPDPGANFRQHLWDYVLLVSHGEQADDLSDWLRTFYAEPPYAQPAGAKPREAQSAAHAVAKWREERSLPWLIAALQLAGPGDPDAEDLLKAASQLRPSSPGYLTMRYYALRMVAREKQPDAARKELDALLSWPAAELPVGSRNLLNDDRQKLATSLTDFLEHAAEVPTYVGLDPDLVWEGYPQSERARASKGQQFFNAYAARILARRLPLAQLAESARSSALPSHLRREVARSAWTRAILLDDMTVADQLQPLLAELDHPLWTMMESFRSAKTSEDKRFAAVLLTLQNPGLSPSVRAGLLRSATLGEMDHYRDNWWCEDSGEDVLRFATDRGPEPPPPSFLSAAYRTTLKKEMEKLTAAQVAPNYLAAQVLTYAKAHPNDARVPEALHLAVRSTRWGCTNSETTYWSEKAFRLLHQRYPKSEWAEKTKYYF